MWWFGRGRKRSRQQQDKKLERYIRLIGGNITHLTSVDLGGRNVSDESTKRIASGLTSNVVITKLNLSFGNISVDGASAIGKMLHWNATIMSLNLMNNKMGPEGIRYLAEGLKQNGSLRTLCLGWNAIEDVGAIAVSEGLQHHTALRRLLLMGNNVGVESTRAIARVLSYGALTTLDLEGNNMGAQGARALAIELCNNKTLQKLFIGGNCIKTEGAVALADALERNSILEVLWLNQNDIGVEGVVALGIGLRTNTSLSELHLEKNDIELAGAQAFGQCLTENKTLTKLWLDEGNVGCEGAKILALALCQSNTLTSFSLTLNYIGNEGAAVLATTMYFNSTITSFFLDRNDIGDRVRTKIEKRLAANKKQKQIQGDKRRGANAEGKQESRKKRCSFPGRVASHQVMPVDLFKAQSQTPNLLGSPANTRATCWSLGEVNTVTYLFSDPLVWEDDDGMTHPASPRLEFSREVSLLERTLHESERNIRFTVRVATWQNLLHQAQQCGYLHISCHGLPPAHIMLEDEAGGACFISAEHLSEMLLPFPEPFHFVFVAACNSEMIGEAFVQSGVRHVLCCEINSRLLNDAATDFAHTFYTALSRGYTINAAYLVAQACVTTGYGKQESAKYILLPRDRESDHDVALFRANCLESNDDLQQQTQMGEAHVPHLSPLTTVGLEAQTHQVLCAMQRENSNLVTILGGRIDQRTALARAVCEFVRDRLGGSTAFDSVMFVNGRNVDPTLSQQTHQLLVHLLEEELRSRGIIHDSPGRKGGQLALVCNALERMKTLLILDGFGQDRTMVYVLQRLFDKVRRITVVLTSPCPLECISPDVKEKIIRVE